MSVLIELRLLYVERVRAALSSGIVILLATCGIASSTLAQQWQTYTDVRQAGFDPAALDSAEAYYARSRGAACLLLVNGAVVANWGETTRRFPCASVRKGILSALIGNAIQQGTLKTSQTLTDLGITEKTPLSSAEQSATVADLLTSRSGVYLPAAYETKVWADRRPPRGSHPPGSLWYYNNWDFNVLGVIVSNQAHASVGDLFYSQIAERLHLEDYRSLDYSELLESASIHPAYQFKLSARDMARFGQCYLDHGRWDGSQIIDSAWIAACLSSSVQIDSSTSFGYLWFTTTLNGQTVHFTRGAGVQGIYLVPERRIVMVFRSDLYANRAVNDGIELELLRKLLQAQVSLPVNEPTQTVSDWPSAPSNPQTVESTSFYIGDYRHKQLGVMSVVTVVNTPLLKTKIGTFLLSPIRTDEFWIEDMNISGKFIAHDSVHAAGTSELTFSDQTKSLQLILTY